MKNSPSHAVEMEDRKGRRNSREIGFVASTKIFNPKLRLSPHIPSDLSRYTGAKLRLIRARTHNFRGEVQR